MKATCQNNLYLTENAIYERAAHKAFAKIETLGFLIQTDERNLAMGSYGGDISLSDFMLIVEGNKTELKVWQYIAELLEKSNI
tara:strand:- start:686 stop:934 length:249 start_codon:yes stop_codon:yes gene_type:complete